jgi:hypothetical protein
MPGSRKGEKRGAAGRRRRQESDALGIEKPHGKHARRPGRTHEEYYRDVVKFVNNETANQDEPREVMLEAMRYFQDQAREYLQMAQWLRRQVMNLRTQGELEANDLQLARVEAMVKDFYQTAVDVAYKCAPYVHSRFQAIAVHTSSNKGPIEMMGLILNEIDEANRGRPSWAPTPATLELEAEHSEAAE